jgi:hypothetical protein
MKLLVVLALLAASTGCTANSGAKSPDQVLHEYALALEQGRVRDAYALLSQQAQRDLPFEAYERMVRENPDEVLEVSRSLLRPRQAPYVTATVTAPDGQVLRLVYEDGRWMVDASTIDLYSQATPEAAVQAFVRAFENRRYDVLMRFVPNDKREGLNSELLKQAWEGEQREEIERFTQALKASMATARAEQIGDRATLQYGAGAQVELLREDGVWKIEEF